MGKINKIVGIRGGDSLVIFIRRKSTSVAPWCRSLKSRYSQVWSVTSCNQSGAGSWPWKRGSWVEEFSLIVLELGKQKRKLSSEHCRMVAGKREIVRH